MSKDIKKTTLKARQPDSQTAFRKVVCDLWGQPYNKYQIHLSAWGLSVDLSFYRLPHLSCVVCGGKATACHYSFIGSIPWPVCAHHHKHTSPAFVPGHWDETNPANSIMATMGLMDRNGQWVPMKFSNLNHKK